MLPSGIFMAAVKRLLSALWKLLAIVRSFRTAARNFRRLARNFRRLARNLHAVAGAVLLRLFHHVVAQLLEWFSASCSYIIVVICPFLPAPLTPPTPRLGVGGVRGAGCFSVSLLLRAHSVASTTCAVLASGGVRRHMGSDTLQHVPLIALSGKVGQSPLTHLRVGKFNYLILTSIFFRSLSALELPTISSYLPGTTRMVLVFTSQPSKLWRGRSMLTVFCSPAFSCTCL